MWARRRNALVSICGRLANLAGLPCFVSAAEYYSDALDTTVRVRASHLYTIVTVNDIDVYFNRLTGSFDGVGVRSAAGCLSAARALSMTLRHRGRVN